MRQINNLDELIQLSLDYTESFINWDLAHIFGSDEYFKAVKAIAEPNKVVDSIGGISYDILLLSKIDINDKDYIERVKKNLPDANKSNWLILISTLQDYGY